ncbi:MAG TPA: nucleotide sugar dehydrogenase [Dehalococcoidia bacterium]|nr:nucleotide sugar dehydrogenase [Dehalococcoidia bacterium]
MVNGEPKATVIGLGRIGLPTALWLTWQGHRVMGIDRDPSLVAAVNSGEAPFGEPGLREALLQALGAGLLEARTAHDERTGWASYHFICVDTGSWDGTPLDLRNLEEALADLLPYLHGRSVVVIRSTVPPGTTEDVRLQLAALGIDCGVAFNPEFLREGSALHDVLFPDRMVIGADDEGTAQALSRLVAPVPAPKLFCSSRSAELVKYASNALLALQVSFANELARHCERVGADVYVVAQALRLDPRIGPRAYLEPGLGFGGPCLPKDLAVLAEQGRRTGAPLALVEASLAANRRQWAWAFEHLETELGELEGARIAVVGLTFKAGVDDLRASPALALAGALHRSGAQVTAFDPWLQQPERLRPDISWAADIYDAAAGADALVIALPWTGLAQVDWTRLHAAMRRPLLLDCRGALRQHDLPRRGFDYVCLGLGRLGRCRDGNGQRESASDLALRATTRPLVPLPPSECAGNGA